MTVDVSLFAGPEAVEVMGALADELGEDWCLVGGLMVGVHLAAAGREPLRVTKDVDLLIDWPRDHRGTSLRRFDAPSRASNYGRSVSGAKHAQPRGFGVPSPA